MRSKRSKNADFLRGSFSVCGECSGAILIAREGMTPFPKKDFAGTRKINDLPQGACGSRGITRHQTGDAKAQINERDNSPLWWIKNQDEKNC